MADNFPFTGGSGLIAAADDVSGVLYQRVKIAVGADGTATDASVGSGVIDGGTLRWTHATDDPAVVALQIMDDWDESDRAKVNIIAGQAGISAGAGAVAANTPRTTLASDDPAVVSLQLIDDVVKLEDAVHGSGDAGIMALAVRTDSPANKSGTNGDYEPLQISAGRLWTSTTVTSTIPGTTATSLGKAEDAAHASGDTGVAVWGVRRSAKAISSGTDGDYSTINLSDAGDLRVDGGQAFVVRVTPTVTAGAYTADDCMGGEQTITAAARISGGGGVLTGITMVAEDDASDGWVANDVEVLIFDSNPAGTYTDNNALDGSALTDADAALLLGTVLLDTKVDLGDITMLKATNVNIPYVCSGSANLFAVAVNRGGKTPEATDALTFTYHFIRD